MQIKKVSTSGWEADKFSSEWISGDGTAFPVAWLVAGVGVATSTSAV